MGNMPSMREYRNVTFTTDSLGFHNATSTHGVPDILVLGDSFALASEVAVDQSFAGVLSSLRGRTVYNAAGEEPLRLAPLLELSRRLRMRRGYVVYEFLERHLSESPPLTTATGTTGLHALPPRFFGTTRWEELRLPIWHLVEFSPTQALAQKMEKLLCNGVLLPNRYSQNVLVRQLTNGDNLLFLASDRVSESGAERQVASWAAYLEWLARELKKDDLTLVVMLVPNKYTVYQHFLSPVDNGFDDAKTLCRLQVLLGNGGVPVVNLVERYRQQASSDLSVHDYIYWRDDTHWNERGMRIAADMVDVKLAEEDLQLALNSGQPTSQSNGSELNVR